MADFTILSDSATARTLAANEKGIVGADATLAVHGGYAINAGEGAVLAILGSVVSSNSYAILTSRDFNLSVGSFGNILSGSHYAVGMADGSIKTINNAGTISGANGGISWTGLGVAAGIGFSVTNSGTIQGAQGYGLRLYVTNADSKIANSGTISGGLHGIVLDSSDSFGVARVEVLNSGDILGADTGFSGTAGSEAISNSGRIIASAEDGVAIYGRAGEDKVLNSGTIIGTVNLGSDDDLYRATGDGIVLGTVEGWEGNDTLSGAGGDDSFDGGDDADFLRGGAGDDTLLGGTGSDTLRGAAGDDLLEGGSENDVLRAGAGEDFAYGDNGDDVIYGAGGDDNLFGGNNNDRLSGGVGDDNLFGSLGIDTLFGGPGEDTVNGGGWNDVVNGGAGDDLVLGELGNDTLSGGTGDDTLTGGAGDDVFVYRRGHELVEASDFVDGQDRIDLSSWGFVNFLDVQNQHDVSDTTDGVRFDFGGGDVLVVNGATIATLSFPDFLF